MLLTISQAEQRYCPFSFNGTHPAHFCVGPKCMAWRTEHAAIRREDHSGAYDLMCRTAVETERILRREKDILILDEVGTCARLTTTSDC